MPGEPGFTGRAKPQAWPAAITYGLYSGGVSLAVKRDALAKLSY